MENVKSVGVVGDGAVEFNFFALGLAALGIGIIAASVVFNLRTGSGYSFALAGVGLVVAVFGWRKI